MFKIKHPLATLVVVAAALAVATSGLGWQGPPVVNEQFRPPPEVHPMTWCGEVEGTAVDTIVEHYMQDASGNIIDNVHFTRVFTAPPLVSRLSRRRPLQRSRRARSTTATGRSAS
jgi:hypothetical protein